MVSPLHRLHRLTSLFRSLRHKRDTPISGNEEEDSILLRLPLSKPPSFPSLPPSELDLLRFSFSVFGLVTPGSRRDPRVSLSLVCRGTRAQIPIAFFETFGGSLSIQRRGVGAVKSNLWWVVRGSPAEKIAAILSANHSRKQSLLDLAASWPSHPSELQKARDILKKEREILKYSFFEGGKVTSWSEFVELFEARGAVTCDLTAKCVRLKVSHVNRDLLESISDFLAAEKVTLYMQSMPSKSVYLASSSTSSKNEDFKTFAWSCNRTEATKAILQNLLEKGVVFQRGRAERGLEMMDSSLFERLPPLTNSHRYTKLQGATVHLSAFIFKLQNKKNSLKNKRENESSRERKLHKNNQEKIFSLEKLLSSSIKIRKKMKISDSICLLRRDIVALLRG